MGRSAVWRVESTDEGSRSAMNSDLRQRLDTLRIDRDEAAAPSRGGRRIAARLPVTVALCEA